MRNRGLHDISHFSYHRHHHHYYHPHRPASLYRHLYRRRCLIAHALHIHRSCITKLARAARDTKENRITTCEKERERGSRVSLRDMSYGLDAELIFYLSDIRYGNESARVIKMPGTKLSLFGERELRLLIEIMSSALYATGFCHVRSSTPITFLSNDSLLIATMVQVTN